MLFRTDQDYKATFTNNGIALALLILFACISLQNIYILFQKHTGLFEYSIRNV